MLNSFSIFPDWKVTLVILTLAVCTFLALTTDLGCNSSSNNLNSKLYKQYEESYNRMKDSLQQEYDLLMLSRDSVSSELIKVRQSHPSVQYVTKYSSNTRVVKELRSRAEKLQDSLVEQRMFLISEYHYLEDSLENIHDYYTQQMSEIINVIQANTIVVPFKSNYEDEYMNLDLTVDLDSTKTQSLVTYDVTLRDSLIFSHAVKRTRPWPFGKKLYTVSAVSSSPYIREQKVNGYTFKRR